MTKREIERELRRILPLWQGVLNIPHWRVTVSLDLGRDFGDDLAEVEYDHHARSAVVVMSDFRKRAYDVEEALVHELVHLVLMDLCEALQADNRGVAVDTEVEQAVDGIAQSFVNLKRYSSLLGQKDG